MEFVRVGLGAGRIGVDMDRLVLNFDWIWWVDDKRRGCVCICIRLFVSVTICMGDPLVCLVLRQIECRVLALWILVTYTLGSINCIARS